MKPGRVQCSILLFFVCFVTSGALGGTPDQGRQPNSANSSLIQTPPDLRAPSTPVDKLRSQQVSQQVRLDTVVLVASDATTRIIYDYFPSGQQKGSLVQRWHDGTWQDSLRTFKTWNPGGLVSSELVEFWRWGGIHPQSRASHTYDEFGNVLSSVWEEGSGGPLSPTSRILYTYDTLARTVVTLLQKWSAGWYNNIRWTSIRNSDGQVIGHLSENWTHNQWDTSQYTEVTYRTGVGSEEHHWTRYRRNSVWSDSALYRAFYDASGRLYLQDEIQWSGGNVMDARMTVVSYDGQGKVLSVEDQRLEQGSMVLSSRTEYAYDEFGRRVSELEWRRISGEWGPVSKITSTYDAGGNIKLGTAEVWSGQAWVPADVPSWQRIWSQLHVVDGLGNTNSYSNFTSITFGYRDLTTAVGTGDRESPNEFQLFQNYPNPFNPSTTIGYGLPAQSHVTLAVFNTLGQQVAVLQNGEQRAGYHEVRFDASALPSGIYYYRLHSGSYTGTKRLVLLR
jgi:hypothetical protein